MPIFYILSLLIIFTTLISLIIAIIQKRKILTVNKVNNTRRIVYIAIFSAIMAILNFIEVPGMMNNKISFTVLALVLSV